MEKDIIIAILEDIPEKLKINKDKWKVTDYETPVLHITYTIGDHNGPSERVLSISINSDQVCIGWGIKGPKLTDPKSLSMRTLIQHIIAGVVEGESSAYYMEDIEHSCKPGSPEFRWEVQLGKYKIFITPLITIIDPESSMSGEFSYSARITSND